MIAESESPMVRFDPDDEALDPEPRGQVSSKPNRVVIKVAKKEYKGVRHAAVQFGQGTEWVRRWFDGLILPNPSATLCPGVYVRNFIQVLLGQEIEVVVERSVWDAVR